MAVVLSIFYFEPDRPFARKWYTCKLYWYFLDQAGVYLKHKTTPRTHTILLPQLVAIVDWVGARVYVLFVAAVGGTASVVLVWF